MTAPVSLYRLASDLGVALSPYARRALRAEPADQMPRTPADLLAEIEAAARIATTYNQDGETK